MKVTTRAVFDIESGILLGWEGYEYEGTVALCGGGPSQQQKDAAAAQANLSNKEAATGDIQQARETDAYNKILPYATSRLNGGLPFTNNLLDYAHGALAQSYAPARANLVRSMSSMGDLPSGYKQQALTNMDESQAQAFDNNIGNTLMANEQAKANAAGLLAGQQQIANPLGFYGAAGNSNSSIMQAPLQTPGWQGVVGGVLGGAAGNATLASKIPF